MKNLSKQVVILDELSSPYIPQAIIILKKFFLENFRGLQGANLTQNPCFWRAPKCRVTRRSIQKSLQIYSRQISRNTAFFAQKRSFG